MVPLRKSGDPKNKLVQDNQEHRAHASLNPVFEKRGQDHYFLPTVFTGDFVQGGHVPH